MQSVLTRTIRYCRCVFTVCIYHVYTKCVYCAFLCLCILGTTAEQLEMPTGQGPELSGWTMCAVWAMRRP